MDADAGLLAKNSMSVVVWTTVSRVTGFVRIAVIGAVLGPTYLGNIFQATNNLPMIAYAALTGSLFSNLLVPPLVRRLDRGDQAAAGRLAGAFLTVALLAFGVVCVLILLAGPLVLRLLSLGVPDPAVAEFQRDIGLILLVVFTPQMLLYAVVGTAEAVMNAHGRFTLAAAAPALENGGIIATMTACALIYGTGDALAHPSTEVLLLLGLGTTAAVGLHAGVQWWGARSVGVVLRPRRPWQEPELMPILHRAVPSLGFSALEAVQPIGAMVVANRVPGGVLAFQFALQFYWLPSALGARPVAVALLPRLARLARAPDQRPFRDELVRGASLVAFLTVPAAAAYVVLREPLAAAVTFGRMATEQGHALVEVSLAALAPGVLGYAALLVGTYACYARHDARTPFHMALMRAGIAACGMVVAFLVPAAGLALLILGLTISTADIVGGGRMAVRLRRALPRGEQRLGPPLLRTVAASAVMVVPAYLVARYLAPLLPASSAAQVAMVACVLVGGAVFVLMQWWWRSPELLLIGAGLRPRGLVSAGRAARKSP